jgi:hypothetical protein
MSTNFLGVTVFALFGIFMIFVITTTGYGNSLATNSGVNKIGTLNIFDMSTKTLVGMNLGNTDNITSITLTFKNSIPDNGVVGISLKNSTGGEIGSGSTTISPSSTVATFNLMNTVTALERTTLRTVSVTVT